VTASLAFELPPALEAREPPEARGLRRDAVRLLVARGRGWRGGQQLAHATFADLPQFLSAGDLLVVNVSATLPASLPGRFPDGTAVRVHYSTRAPGLPGWWGVIELRTADGARPLPRTRRAGRLILSGGAGLELVAPYASGSRLMLSRTADRTPLSEQFVRQGKPIRYGYVDRSWPLEAYQTVFAATPGSAEMPSAGRPFTTELIRHLSESGVAIAPITLHCGVSSPERHEPPFPEWYEVPEGTARLVRLTRAAGHRVIAVGTTVVRALETSAQSSGGGVRAACGWTNLVVTPATGASAVDGLITGWHEPQASHLQMLEAIAGRELLERSYAEAVARGYLWHEFGDSHLLLP
jgi:S-adenosylmethionine:tRNA ribosyltransferase-isomerase